jgi:hypothetical protein
MTGPSSYGFVPWVRRGLASLARTAPTRNFLGAQVTLAVNTVAAQPVAVRLHGPGQVTGVDPRAIVRMEPRPDTTTFEPNYLAAIEFATPDFPWAFTPALPNGAALKPWICLVVVRDQPGVSLVPRQGALTLLEFAAPAVPLDELPNLDQIAQWAHAQVVGDAATSDGAVRAALDGTSQAHLSRLVCPRRLQPTTNYIACLVPTYHAGVAAGISPDLPIDDADVAPAWDAHVVAPFSLPVYATWRFSTGVAGDFASLARRMRPPTQPLRLGIRDLDVSAPGFGMPAFANLVRDLDGALKSRETVTRPWPPGVQAQFEAAIRPLLVPPAGPVPIVAPPVYGQAASGAQLPAPGAPPQWLRDLNVDPARRAIAGMGTDIVRADQEELMASAWDQYEAVRSANQLLRQMQLARAVSLSTSTRHFAALDGAGTFLQLTRPMHARLRLNASSPVTLHAQISSSRIASGAVSAAFRRVARRRGPVGRMLFAGGAPSRIVERFNTPIGTVGAVTALSARVPPQGAVLLDAVATFTTSVDLVPTAVAAASGWTSVGAVVVGETFTGLTTGGAPTTAAAGTAAMALPVAHIAGPAPALRVIDDGGDPGSGTGGGGTGGGTTIVTAPPLHGDPNAPLWLNVVTVAFPFSPEFPTDPAQYAEMERRFRAAAEQVTTYVSTRTTRISDAPDRPSLAATLAVAEGLALTAIDPAVTIVARARAQLALPTTGDPLRPLLAQPVFPRPMSRELTAQQLLPGVDRVPPDTAAVVVTNPAFVEAFMVGLNDEMRRELAWRQYPFDQRATFFTNFWGATSNAGAAVDDIHAISTWNVTSHLGSNSIAHGEQAVLLLRGELLRRYPNAIISAVQAQPGPNNTRTLTTTELFPIFRGSIDPDMVFFGFALSSAAATAGAGWYFVLAEHPTEPRFGFEPATTQATLTTWNNLAWPQVAVRHNHVDLSVAPPSAQLEGATWNANSAQQAFIAFRRPVRVALHASTLLA